jgi:hypothetical protein
MHSIDGGSAIVVSSFGSTGSGPWARRRYRSIAARRAIVNSHGASGRPGVQERDLNGVRGQFPVTEDPQRDREHRPGVALVDGTDPFGATGAKGVGKIIFVHWTGLALAGRVAV